MVDYIGLKKELFEALQTYTNRDQDKIQENDEAKVIALDILEILIRDGAEFVQGIEQRKSVFMEQTKRLKDVYKICTALLSKREKDEVRVLTSAGSQETFDLLNENNINKLRALPQENIAANILMRAMKDKVEQVKKKNIVVSRPFSEKYSEYKKYIT